MAKKTKAQVQFEADTSGFTQGIKEADKSLTTLRKELNLNSAELKENADDVDLLAKRKTILQNELEQTSSKIENLKKKLDVAKTSFGENSKEVYQLRNKILDTQTSFQKIQNELTQTDSKLNTLESGLNEVETEMKQVDNASDNLSDGFTTMKGVVADLAADGIQQLSGALKDLAVDSDTAYSNFQAQTGASSKEMKEFESSIESVYSKNFGDSINDVANAMAQVKQQTKETDPSNLQKMTENALTLRDTFDFDVAESMRAVNSLTKQFGISSDEAFNLVVQGAQNGLNANGDMLDVINEYSVQYKNAGYSANDMFNSLMNGANEGTWSIDKMGDAIKEMNIRFSDGTVTDALEENKKALGLTSKEVDNLAKEYGKGGEHSQKAIKKMIDSIMSVEDETERYKLGVSVFGTMWEDLGEDTVVAMMSTKGGIDSAKQSMEELAQVKYDNVTSQMQEIGRTIQMDVLVPIAEDLLPIVKDGLEWIKNNLDWLLPVITGIGIAFGTYFAVSKIMGIIDVFKTMFTLVKSGTTIMGALNTVMAMNPVGLVVAAIVGLIAIFVLLWNKCDGFREFWLNLWDKIKSLCSSAIEGIKKAIDVLKEWIPKAWNSIKETTSKVWNGIKSFLSSLWNGIKNTATSVFNGIKNFLSNLWNGIKSVASSTWNWIKNTISSIINGIKTTITNVFNSVKNFISNVWNGIKNTISNVVNGIKNTISSVWNGIKSVTTSVFNGVKNVASNVWNTIKATISDRINSIKSTVSSVFNGVKSTVSNVFNSIKSTATSKWNSIKNAIMNPIKTAKSEVTSAVDRIKNAFNFKWSIPKPKIPSFSVSGGKAPWGFMGKGKLPSIKIKWNKDGAIFTKPTIMDTNQGLQGVGEAGAEAVLPIEKLENWVNRGFNNIVNNNYYASEKIDRLIEVAEEILQKPFNTYLNGRKVSEEIASPSDKVNSNRYGLKERGLAL